MRPPPPASRTATLKSHIKDRPGHDRRYAIDEGKARAELGYRAAHGFDTRFRETLGWFLANEAWWQAVVSGAYRDWIARHYS